MVSFRFAERKDVRIVFSFIKALAEYEKMSDEVIANEDLLEEWIFDKKKAEVLFAMDGNKEVGMALFFHNFSTFVGRAGIYVEDIFVFPENRHKGYGKALFKKIT